MHGCTRYTLRDKADHLNFEPRPFLKCSEVYTVRQNFADQVFAFQTRLKYGVLR